jgi:hypothetical protein
VGLGALAGQEPQGEAEPFDLTAPAFVDRALTTGQEVGLQLVEISMKR